MMEIVKMDYALARKKMAEEQLKNRGIKNNAILDAFYKIERHKFIPEDLWSVAYSDFPLPIGEGQTISQPYIVALMTEYLDLTGKEKVLEIGTGSGYQTAILAELSKEVFSIERLENLAKNAQKTIKEAGYANVKIKIGDGSLGIPEEAPFDRIIITAASPRIPLPLSDQLNENGRLVLPLGDGLTQTLTLAKKINGKIEPTQICGCVFVPLIGKYGQQR